MKKFAGIAAAMTITTAIALAQPPGPGNKDGGRGGNPDHLVERLMNFDKNEDGKLTKEEIPERLQNLFNRADKDEDGQLTTEEIRADLGAREGADRPRGRRGGRQGDKRGHGGRRGRPMDGRGGPGGPGHHGPPPNPIIEAIDADKDGEISADEMANAATALKSLDKDGDGTLTRSELRPPRPMHGGLGGPGGPRGSRGEGRFQDRSPEERVAFMLKRFDSDGDDALSGDEIPQRMKDHMDKVDSNGDGTVDKSELEAMAQKQAERGGHGKGRGKGPGRKRDKPSDDSA